jgi:two-component system, LytTR family, response regulator
MITATIVDDEPYCCEALCALLERYIPEVKVIDVCYSATVALQSIQNRRPQILFLDVEMPHVNGFEMLEKLPEVNFHLIFTTSYDHYALKAIRYSALDYLLKPIGREDLQKAVQKAFKFTNNTLQQQMEILLQKLHHPSKSISKIAIPTMEGLQMINVETIISCSADSNYTVIFLKDRSKLTASRTLKDMEEILKDYLFARVHHSHIVNLNEIEKYIKGEGGYLMMSDGSNIDVSKNRKELLLKRLKPGVK